MSEQVPAVFNDIAAAPPQLFNLFGKPEVGRPAPCVGPWMV